MKADIKIKYVNFMNILLRFFFKLIQSFSCIKKSNVDYVAYYY